jgi:hypothetical protein
MSTDAEHHPWREHLHVRHRNNDLARGALDSLLVVPATAPPEGPGTVRLRPTGSYQRKAWKTDIQAALAVAGVRQQDEDVRGSARCPARPNPDR